MSTFTWSLDITDGVMINHALSGKIRFASVADTQFVRFTRPEPNYGKNRGGSITIQRVRNIAEPTTAILDEQTRIPVDTIALSTTSVTPVEIGRAVEYTSLVNQLNNFNMDEPIQRKLKSQLSLILDTMAAAAFKTAKIKYIPTSLTGGTYDTDGTPSTAATANLTIEHLGSIRDYLKRTVHAEPWEGGDYVGIFDTKALRGIKQDPVFIEWSKYIRPGDVLFNSEVGKVEQIRLLESVHTNALSGTKGTGSVLGEGVVFGSDAVAMAEVITPHMRAAIPGDFGRVKAVAWYGDLQFGIVWDTANDGEANIIHVTSS